MGGLDGKGPAGAKSQCLGSSRRRPELSFRDVSEDA